LAELTADRVSLGSGEARYEFCSTILRWRCRLSVAARRRRRGHQHAITHALAVDQVGDDPVRYLLLGPNRAANLLELVVLDRPHGPAVIHAMAMRAKYRRLLPGGR